MRATTRILVLLAILASLFSFLKFSHCEKSVWAGPDQYIHACYSDLPALFSSRAFGGGQWAYSGGESAVEYPALQGLVMWATTQVSTDSPVTYFRINVIFIAVLFLFTVLILHRIRPEYSYLYPLAPTVIAALYINWDLWAIASMLLAIYWFDRKSYLPSAVALGVSIATKFFPIFLLLPIAIYFLRKAAIKDGAKYLAISLGTFVAINIPFAVTAREGWWRFYDLNLHRDADWGSLWYGLTIFNINISHINYFTILTLLIGVSIVSIFLLQTRETLSLASSAFYIFVLVMAVGKVYSPQYILWLTPLAILAMKDKRDLPWFWFWQIVEIGYHIAIWQHLALITDSKYGVGLKLYGAVALLRIAASLALAIVLARRHRSSGSFPREFLLSSGESYP
jgi:uncharacterized membrane protein